MATLIGRKQQQSGIHLIHAVDLRWLPDEAYTRPGVMGMRVQRRNARMRSGVPVPCQM